PNLETFLRSKVSDTSVLSEPFPIYHTSRLCTTDLPMMPSKYLDQHIQQLAYLNCLRHSIRKTTLTLETLVIRQEGFSPSSVTHTGILTSQNSINPHSLTSSLWLRSPTTKRH
ncbi:2650_t:CDS:2, partial [Entrophospora sp. SA101]